VISDAVKDTNDKGWSQENWRNAVAVMSWVAGLLSCFIAFICLIDVSAGRWWQGSDTEPR
jgi:hypothetical protein